MFTKVLFPTDFSRHAEKILQDVSAFHAAGMQEAVLLHVINPMKAARWMSVDEQVLERAKDIAREALEKITARLKLDYEIKAKGRVEIGVVYHEIVRVVQEERATLIVMGSHGHGYIKGALLGSVTLNVLRQTPVPLFIQTLEPNENEGPDVTIDLHFCRKILFPTDFSENSLMALQMLKACRKGCLEGIVLVHVQDTRRLIPHLKKKMEEFNRIDTKRLARLKHQLEFFGLEAKTILTEGVPSQEINRIAEEEDASMIVFGSHGRSAITESLLGSVAEALALRHIRPLMVIPRIWEI